MSTENSPTKSGPSAADLQSTATMALLGMLSTIACELVRNGQLNREATEVALDHITREFADDPQEQGMVDRMTAILKKAMRAGEQK